MSMRKSFLLSFYEKYSSLMINFVASMIIARLLTPEEIGIFSVTFAFTSLAHMLRDFGVGDYLVKEKELTKEKIGTVFGIAIVLAWSVGGALFLLSGIIADFYEEPGIKNILNVICVSFLIIPLSSPILPILRRNMQFDRLLRINLASNFMHSVAAISFALNGFSYMSLAWSSLAAVLTTFVLAQYYRPPESKVIPCLKEYKNIVSFGGIVSLGTLIGQLGRNSAELVIGKIMDFSSVGIYSRAQGIVKIFQQSFLTSILPVFHAGFAEKIRDGSDIRETYLKGIEYIAVISWPIYGFLGIFSEEIILLLFGDQWISAGPIASILCVAAAVYAISTLSVKVLLASGEATKLLKVQIIIQSIWIILAIIGAFFSLLHVAFFYIVPVLISFIYHSYFVKLLYGINMAEILVRLIKSIAVLCWSVSLSLVIFWYFESLNTNNHLNLVLSSITFSATWVFSVFLTKHVIREEVQLFVASVRAKFRKL